MTTVGHSHLRESFSANRDGQSDDAVAAVSRQFISSGMSISCRLFRRHHSETVQRQWCARLANKE